MQLKNLSNLLLHTLQSFKPPRPKILKLTTTTAITHTITNYTIAMILAYYNDDSTSKTIIL